MFSAAKLFGNFSCFIPCVMSNHYPYYNLILREFAPVWLSTLSMTRTPHHSTTINAAISASSLLSRFQHPQWGYYLHSLPLITEAKPIQLRQIALPQCFHPNNPVVIFYYRITYSGTMFVAWAISPSRYFKYFQCYYLVG